MTGNREVKNQVDFDLLVMGAGVAGCAAAVAAARRGQDVLLVDDCTLPGGMATGAWVTPMMTFHDAEERPVVGGLPQEVVTAMVAAGGSPGHVPDTIGMVRTITPCDASILARVLGEMLESAGVKVWNPARVVAASADGRMVTRAMVSTAREMVEIRAAAFIDASGDGTLAAGLGVPGEVGNDNDGLCQPMSLIFSVGGVDRRAVIEYILANRDDFHPETRFEQLESTPYLGVSGFFREVAASGWQVPRDRLLFFEGLHPGEMLINTTRIQGRTPLVPGDLFRARREGERQAVQIFELLRRAIPGFGDSILLGLAPRVGVRESRRIIGRRRLTAQDVVEGVAGPESIALGAFPIDFHHPKDQGITFRRIGGSGSYGIPYSCLLTGPYDNLLVVGRCMSATQEAHASARLQPNCMAMGQAAGTAVDLASKLGCSAGTLPVEKLRAALIADGAILELS